MTLAVAHRGDPRAHIENTMESFRSAVDKGADMLELDCRTTADGVVVALHDATLHRLWGVPRALASMSRLDVAAVTVDGTSIPTFEEVLDEIVLPLMVDLPEAAAVDAVLEDVSAARAWPRCVFVGELDALRVVRRRAPGARIGLTWKHLAPPSREILDEIGPEYFNPHYLLSSADAVRDAHEAGRRVSVWTVDSREVMADVIAAGVDAIVTNDIADLVAVLARSAHASEPMRTVPAQQ